MDLLARRARIRLLAECGVAAVGIRSAVGDGCEVAGIQELGFGVL